VFVLTPIANKIAPSSIMVGVDSSQDCSRVECVLDFENGRIVPGLIQFGTTF